MIECKMLELKRDQIVKIPIGARILDVGNHDERNGAVWFMYDRQPGPAPQTYDLHLMLLPDRAALVTKWELMGRFTAWGSDNYFVFKVPEDEVKRRLAEELAKNAAAAKA